jgi:hypothetical protein
MVAMVALVEIMVMVVRTAQQVAVAAVVLAF